MTKAKYGYWQIPARALFLLLVFCINVRRKGFGAIVMNKKILTLVSLGVAAAAGAYWYMLAPQSVAVVNPQIGPAIQAIYATGTVEPGVMLPIAPKIGARLTSLSVDEGLRVQKGQLLAQMEDLDIQKTIAELEARFNLAKADFERRSALLKSGAVSTQSVDKAKSDFEAAAAAIERAKAEQDFLRLYAPEEGLIIKRDGEVGEFISAGQPVFWLECCAPLRITAEVDEEDISLIRPGQEVLIRADAFPGQNFAGTVSAITPKGDPVTRSYRVRIALNGETPLMTGMTAETNIVIRKTETAVLVPAEAVNNNRIWIIEQESLKRAVVKAGARAANAVEILEPALSESSIIVMDGGAELSDGDSIPTHHESWSLEP